MRVRKSTEERKVEIVQAALAFEVGPEGVATGMIAETLGLPQPRIMAARDSSVLLTNGERLLDLQLSAFARQEDGLGDIE